MSVKKMVLGLMLGMGLASGLSSAYAAVINLNSYSNGGPFDREINLRNPVLYPAKAGVYKIEFLSAGQKGAAFTAWNGWSNVLNCDSNGTNCQNGWEVYFRYDTIAAQSVEETQVMGEIKRYSTPEAAFKAAKKVRYIIVDEDTTLRFFIPDNWHYDNSGGISFNITPLVEGPGITAPGKR